MRDPLPLDRTRTLTLASVCLLILPVAWLAWTRYPGSPADVPTPAAASSPIRSPFDAALREAWQRRTQARLAENQRRESLEAWDPQAAPGGSSENLRRQQLSEDPSGDMQRARSLARQAAALAQSTEEKCRAAQLLARIECELGHHEAELQQAQLLVALAPRNYRSLEELHHAGVCNGLPSVVEQAEQAIARLPEPGPMPRQR
jgi:hypothetical protein